MKLIYYNKIKSCNLKEDILPISNLDMRKLINGLYILERNLTYREDFSACISGFNLTRFDCAIIVMENGGFTFYWLTGNFDKKSRTSAHIRPSEQRN